MLNKNKNQYLPHLLIILGFAIFSLLFCFPHLQGKILAQHDVASGAGMSHEGVEWHKKTGENVLWSNSMFGGMPTYMTYVPNSNNLLVYAQSIIESIIGTPALFIFMALLCFYSLMLVLKIERWLGIIGALVYALATYNVVIIVAGHNTKMLSIAYIPAVVAGLLLIYKNKYWTGAALFGLSFALLATNAHYQVIYYLLILLLFIVLGLFFEALKNGNTVSFFKSSLIAIIVGFLGVGATSSTLFSVQEYTKTTMRGGESELTNVHHDKDKKNGGLDKDYAFRWSNGIAETFCILIPDLYGGASFVPAELAPETNEITNGQYPQFPMYWGDQPFLSGPVYFGAAVCFLFLLGLFLIENKMKWWLLGVSILAIMMSWGRHLPGFNYFLFDHLPLLNKFRTPSMVLVLPQFIFPVMAIWCMNDLIQQKFSADKAFKSLKMAAGISIGLCLLLGVGGKLFFDFTNVTNDAQLPKEILSAIKSDRATLAMKSGLISAFYILVAAGLVGAFLKNKINAKSLTIGIGLVMVVDLLIVDHRYLNSENYRDKDEYQTEYFTPRPVDTQILQDPDPYYRVLDITKDVYNDALLSYFHKSVGGYHPAKMEIYQDLIDFHLSKGFNAQVLNMLNTKYFIVPGQNNQPQIMPNQNRCGNAWFVNNIKWAATADEEINELKAANLGDTAKMINEFKPLQTAIVRKSFATQLNGFTPYKDSGSKVELDKYGLNEISYKSKNSREGLAVFSDIWYPYGWKAFVDGKEMPILRANYVLRALRLPAGEHKIEFKFHPHSFYLGNTIALIASLLLILIILIAIFKMLKTTEVEA